VPGYNCNSSSLTCDKLASGGVPKADCDSTCGKPANVTPVFLIGNYRGLEVDHQYVKGEWQAKITQDDIVIVDPTGKTWSKGAVRIYANELWLVSAEGIRRGIYGIQQVPEVSVLTWALGSVGGGVPDSFDDGLSNDNVFVFAKCLTATNCAWHMFQALTQVKAKQQKWLQKFSLEQEPVNDPCSKYPDCHSCITAPEWCGWCSVPILYNNSIPGKNCAGLNVTVTPRINCTGTFSTQDCSFVTTGSTSTGTTSTGQTTGGPPADKKFYCDPLQNNTCVQSANGTLPKDVCDAQCTLTPIVPPVLQNKYFRGLEIDTHYLQGEWRAHFTTTDVTVVSPDGKTIQGTVTTTAEYLTITASDGTKVQSLWQTQPGPAVNNLVWGWGAPNAAPPASFDSAMTTSQQSVYWFVSCHDGSDPNVCDFSK